MDHAAANGDLKMVQWLDTHRNEGCTVRALHRAIKRRDILLVKLLYERRLEVSDWPQLNHARMLLKLLRSKDPQDKEIIGYIIECRRQRCLPLQRTRADIEKDLRRHKKTQVGAIHGLTLVQFVLKHKSPQSSCEDIDVIITQYLIQDPRHVFYPVEAAYRDFVYWLANYGGHGSRHLRRVAHSGNLEGARRMHEYMARTSRGYKCDVHFKLLTMVARRSGVYPMAYPQLSFNVIRGSCAPGHLDRSNRCDSVDPNQLRNRARCTGHPKASRAVSNRDGRCCRQE